MGRRIGRVVVLLAGTALGLDGGSARDAHAASPGVEIVYGEWVDPARGGRIVPYKAYVPAGPGPFPTVLHSHGLGGSREASAYILEPLATAGFLVVALQHPGSDSGLLSGAGRGDAAARLSAGQRGMTAAAAQARYGDVPFAVARLSNDRTLGPKADLARLGMSGHSFGALSTLVAVGQRVPLAGTRFAEPRIRAAIAYSPNKPRNDDPDEALQAVRTPMLHFTGTEDTSPFDLERSPAERTIPFRAIRGADQYLVVLKAGDHAVFGGRRAVAGTLKPTDGAHMALIQAETLRFWRAYLRADVRAAEELCRLPSRTAPTAAAYVKADRCGAPDPLPPLD